MEYRVFGPPGTGKTQFLTGQIARARNLYDSDAVLVATLTRTAGNVLIGRSVELNPDHIGTLHHICYRLLGNPPIAETHISEWWNEEFPLHRMDSSSRSRMGAEEDEEEAPTGKNTPTDLAYQDYQLRRARMIPRPLWPISTLIFADQWEGWKKKHGLTDFTDMIERAWKEHPFGPEGIRCGFLDEVQDMDKLSLSCFRSWAERWEYCFIAGDDDQCQPPGSKVLTTNGYKDIAVLDPALDRLISFEPHEGYLRGFRNGGYGIQVAQREYAGDLLTVQAGPGKTRCTPQHKWLVRWTDQAKSTEAHVVYVMRKGKHFRVGWCKLLRTDVCFHLGARARLEHADAAWILLVTSRTQAALQESYIAARYGLPLVPFHAHAVDVQARAEECFIAYGRDIRYPLWTPQDAAARRGGSKQFLVQATNLLPDYMAIPVMGEGPVPSWAPIQSITAAPYTGPVYSLDVDKYHTYVADGLVTHNSLYEWRGSTPDAFLEPALPAEQIMVLPQSYRIPAAVHRVAQNWVERISYRHPKPYFPRAEEGEVRGLQFGYGYADPIIQDMGRYLSEGKRIMFLVSCNYMLKSMLYSLRQAGIPFHNPLRPSNGAWNPLATRSGTRTADRLLAFLSPSPDLQRHRAHKRLSWTYTEFAQWVEMVKTDGVLTRGVATKGTRKKKRRNGELAPLSAGDGRVEMTALEGDDEVPLSQLEQWFEPQALEAAMSLDCDWLAGVMTTRFHGFAQYPLRIILTQGAKRLLQDPQITIGTTHSVKGGEADVVYLCPDISFPAANEWECRRRDPILRQFYVGMTRAKETLIICAPATQAHVSGLFS